MPDGEEIGKVHSQKVKVNYLPPEGHPLEEEDEFPLDVHDEWCSPR